MMIGPWSTAPSRSTRSAAVLEQLNGVTGQDCRGPVADLRGGFHGKSTLLQALQVGCLTRSREMGGSYVSVIRTASR